MIESRPTTFIVLSGGTSFRVYGDYEELKDIPMMGGQRELNQVLPFDGPPEPVTIVANYVASISPASPKG